MCSLSNSTPISSCMYSLSSWTEQQQQHNNNNDDDHKEAIQNSWILHEADDFYVAHITAPVKADAGQDNERTKDEPEEVFKPLREKNSKRNASCSGYKHVPHKDKPPQVVARRNARERRRVQAVNSAFVRLRKAVPIENARGKRVSKVKTLQNAIQYIQRLQQLLQQDYKAGGGCCPINDANNFRAVPNNQTYFDEISFEDEL